MEAKKAHVFISYARADDEPFVKRLYDHLKDEFEVWWDRVAMPNRGPTFLQEIRDAIDHADRLLLVAGPGAFSSDYVRDEWQYAYQTGKPINIALRLGDYSDLPEELRNFDAPDFRDDADHDEGLATLKRQMAEPITKMGAFHNVPALPPHFLNRPDALDTLRELVIADVDKPTFISAEQRTTAVEGMGGIGKSVLAIAFAHDRKVRFAFQDGIVWLTVGREAKLYELYRAVGVALGDELRNYPDETTARQNAQKMLAEKKILLMLDDVWELSVGRAFRDLISGTVARLLITTRNLQINDVLNANEYRLKLIDRSQAVAYLQGWVGDVPDLGYVAEKLGYLFLALKLAGARMKKDDLSGTEYLQIFDRVSRMKIGPQSTDREDSLDASITLSVDAAFAGVEAAKLLYYSFGIFREDASIPQQTLLQLWGHLRPDVDSFDLLETLNALVDLALLERHKNKTLTLHDLLRSYTREKLGNHHMQMHQALLDSYRVENWHKLSPDEPYLWYYLTYHLINAARYDELRTLLSAQDWMHTRFEHDGHTYTGYLQDVLMAWKGATSMIGSVANQKVDRSALLADCVRYSLIYGSINSLSSNYTPQLIERLLTSGEWNPEQAIAQIDRVVDALRRAEMYSTVLKLGHLSVDRRTEVEEAALLSLQNANQTSQYARILAELTQVTRNEQVLERSVHLIPNIRNERYRAHAIRLMLLQLSSRWMDWLLEQITLLEDEWYCAELLLAIDDLLDAQSRVKADDCRKKLSEKLLCIVEIEPGGLFQVSEQKHTPEETLALAMAVKNKRLRYSILAILEELGRKTNGKTSITGSRSVIRREMDKLAPWNYEFHGNHQVVLRDFVALLNKESSQDDEFHQALAEPVEPAPEPNEIMDVVPRLKVLSCLIDSLSVPVLQKLFLSLSRYAFDTLLPEAKEGNREQAKEVVSALIDLVNAGNAQVENMSRKYSWVSSVSWESRKNLASELDRNRVRTLIAFLPILPEQHAMQWAGMLSRVTDKSLRDMALREFAKYAEQSNVDFEVLFKETILHDERLLSVVPHLLQGEDFKLAWNAALQNAWIDALASLVPYYEDISKADIFQVFRLLLNEAAHINSLQSLAITIGANDLSSLLSDILNLTDVEYQSQVLRRLMPLFNEEDRRTAEAILKMRSETPSYGYARSPYSTYEAEGYARYSLWKAQQSEMYGLMLNLASDVLDGDEERAVALLKGDLPIVDSGHRQVIMEVVYYIADENFRAEAWLRMIPYIKGAFSDRTGYGYEEQRKQEAADFCQQIISNAVRFEKGQYIFTILRSLMSSISESDVNTLINLVNTNAARGTRLIALSAIVDSLEQHDIGPIVNQIVSLLSDDSIPIVDRATSLRAVYPYFPNEAKNDLLAVGIGFDYLMERKDAQRTDMLEFLADVGERLSNFLGDPFSDTVAMTILEVCWEWEWL